jgi:hypothetical protein
MSLEKKVEYRVAQYQEHFSELKDRTLLVLKGHLVIEEILERMIRESCPNSDALDDVDMSFFLKARVARALMPKHIVLDSDKGAQAWECIDALNSLRNEMAHRLVSAKMEAKLERLLSCVRLLGFVHKKDDPDLESASIGYLLGYMGAYESVVLEWAASSRGFDASLSSGG